MNEVRIEDAPETAKALRKECDDCSCFKDPYMCSLGPCQNIKAADLLDAQTAQIAELEAKLNEVTKERDMARKIASIVPDMCDQDCLGDISCGIYPCVESPNKKMLEAIFVCFQRLGECECEDTDYRRNMWRSWRKWMRRPKADAQTWVSVEDGLPEEHDSIFAKYYGTQQWNMNMFRKTSDTVLISIRDETGNTAVVPAHTKDGSWKADILRIKPYEITHWMQLPEPPKDVR